MASKAILIYLDPELDRDLIDWLQPFTDGRRRSEAIRGALRQALTNSGGLPNTALTRATWQAESLADRDFMRDAGPVESAASDPFALLANMFD